MKCICGTNNPFNSKFCIECGVYLEKNNASNVLPIKPISSLCGICGSIKCISKHIPSISQQYNEALENIQKFRHKRYLRNIWKDKPYPMLLASEQTRRLMSKTFGVEAVMSRKIRSIDRYKEKQSYIKGGYEL